MTLYHHDSRPYEQAASEAAKVARDKLEALFARGGDKATQVLKQAREEAPKDQLQPLRALEILPREREVALVTKHGEYDLHRNALGQICERVKFPIKAANTWLAEPGRGPALLAKTMKELLSWRGEEIALIRSVERAEHPEEVRGFLSNRFLRVGAGELAEALGKEAMRLGAVPSEGYITPTRFSLQLLLPQVFEPVPGEVMAFGVHLQSSDYGNGSIMVKGIMLRLWCTNTALSQHDLKRNHIGHQLTDENFNDRELIEREKRKVLGQVVEKTQQVLSLESINTYQDIIRKAHEQKIEPRAINEFLKAHLPKEDGEKVKELFNSADIENMPPGQNRLRFSNAISLFARDEKDGEKKLDLMHLAGVALGVGKTGAVLEEVQN